MDVVVISNGPKEAKCPGCGATTEWGSSWNGEQAAMPCVKCQQEAQREYDRARQLQLVVVGS